MKIVADREELMRAYQVAATIAPQKSPIAILQNVKLEATADGTTLSATDLEIGIRLNVAGIDVQTPGTVLLPVARFGPILRESGDDKLTLESSASGTIVTGDRSQFKLPAANPDEFAAVPGFEADAYHALPNRLLREMIRRTVFATDTESSRYALGGVLMEFEEDKIIAVGTDGRRLAKMEGPARSENNHHKSESMTIIPTKSLLLIERALSFSDAEEEVQLAARANDALLQTSQATIFSRLVEGRFPRWRDVFPKREQAVQLGLTVGPFFAALRQAAVVASQESRGIDLKFGEGTLVFSGLTADVGESRVELPIPYDGEAIYLTLDHRYLADYLKVLESDKSFMMELQDSESAALFNTDDGYGYVIMPLARDS